MDSLNTEILKANFDLKLRYRCRYESKTDKKIRIYKKGKNTKYTLKILTNLGLMYCLAD